jgi:endonuclease/exonuclease/phosphatase family metal-dependent hydrolase
VRIATANISARYSREVRRKHLQDIADLGYAVICVQEVTDDDLRHIAPRGWEHFRPRSARSTGILWNPKLVKAGKRDWYRLSRPEDEVRGITWVAFTDRKTGVRRRVGSVHLPAFKHRNRSRRLAYLVQVARAAKWLGVGRYRVLAGDFNADKDSWWTAPLRAVGLVSAPKIGSGPDNQAIDWFVANRLLGKRPKILGRLRRHPIDHAAVFGEI